MTREVILRAIDAELVVVMGTYKWVTRWVTVEQKGVDPLKRLEFFGKVFFKQEQP